MTLTRDRKSALLSAARLFDGVDARRDGSDRGGRGRGRLPGRSRDRAPGRDRDGLLRHRSAAARGSSATARRSPPSGPATSSASCRSSTDSRAIAQVIADGPTTCLALATWDFEAVLLDEPRVALAILRGLASRLRDLTEAHPPLTADGPRTDDRARRRCRAGPSPSCSATSRVRRSSSRRSARERYGQLLERHRALLRAAWEANGGIEQGTEGDSFFVDVRARRRRRWPPRPSRPSARSHGRALAGRRRPIRVRMGLNTGEPSASESRRATAWSGIDINRAARDRGGRPRRPDPRVRGRRSGLLVDAPASPASRCGISGELPAQGPAGAGPPRPGRSPTGCPSEFPPLRTLDARPNNLPTQLTTFIGRDAELDEAADAARHDPAADPDRPGRDGQDAAVAPARRARRRTTSPTASSSCRSSRSATRCSSRPGSPAPSASPRGPPGRSPSRSPTGCATSALLLVLDNFEQVVSAAPIVADLLRAAPEIKVVVTSRAALHVSGEQEYPVPGLPAPPDPSHLSGLERLAMPGESRDRRPGRARAVRRRPPVHRARRRGPAGLRRHQRERARRWRPSAPGSTGMPLAIELAAARIKLLSPEAILVRLDHQLDVLAAGSRDLPARQQTLRGAIAWSYDLLDDGAQRLLDRLSVFASGCDLAVGGGDLRPVVRDRRRHPRRADGAASTRACSRSRRWPTASRASGSSTRSASTPRSSSRRAARPTLIQAPPSRLVRGAGRRRRPASCPGADQRRWLDRLELEHDDIRAVLDRAVAAPDPPVAIGLAFAMWRFWQKHGHLAEARRAARGDGRAPTGRATIRVCGRKLMEALGGTCWWQGEIVPRWRVCYQEALELWLAHRRRGARSPTPTTTPRSRTRSREDGRVDDADAGPGGHGPRATSRRRATSTTGSATGAARRTRSGGSATTTTSAARPGNGIEEIPAGARDLPRGRRPDDGGLGPAHARDRAPAQRRARPRPRDSIEHAIRHFYAAGDAAGLTLTLDDLSAVAVVEGDLPRAARLRGAARNLTTETGAGLAGFVEDTFEAGVRPGVAIARCPRPTSPRTAPRVRR